MYISDLLFSYDQTFEDTFFDSGIFKGRPTLVQSTGAATVDVATNSADFQAQNDIVAKINTVSAAPGSGISDVLGGFAKTGDSVTLVNVQTSMQLRDQLKNTAVVSSSNSGNAAVITNIQSAATALNVQNTPLAVPTTITLTPDQKQLVLISNIKATEIAETSQ